MIRKGTAYFTNQPHVDMSSYKILMLSRLASGESVKLYEPQVLRSLYYGWFVMKHFKIPVVFFSQLNLINVAMIGILELPYIGICNWNLFNYKLWKGSQIMYSLLGDAVIKLVQPVTSETIQCKNNWLQSNVCKLTSGVIIVLYTSNMWHVSKTVACEN